MPVDIDLIRAYTDGLVAVAPTGTALPTDPTTALNAAFDEVGAISSDGITEAVEQDVTDIFIWQKNALARRIKGNYVKTFQFAAAETNLTTLGVQYPGSTVLQTAYGVSVAETPPTTDIRSWVLHGLDGDREVRIVIPLGEVTERGEVVWSSENITVYQWTLSCYVDSSGNVLYRYIADDELATP
jgi:hypothetical protein